MAFDLHFSKARFKFSSSHFTIFSATEAERLHGHNYQVEVQLTLSEVQPQTGLAIDFNLVKPKIQSLCDQLDERILIPQNSNFLQIKTEGSQLQLKFGEKKYEFPGEDCLMLPMVNICSEALTLWFAENLYKNLFTLKVKPQKIIVKISETQGQAVSYTLTP